MALLLALPVPLLAATGMSLPLPTAAYRIGVAAVERTAAIAQALPGADRAPAAPPPKPKARVVHRTRTAASSPATSQVAPSEIVQQRKSQQGSARHRTVTPAKPDARSRFSSGGRVSKSRPTVPAGPPTTATSTSKATEPVSASTPTATPARSATPSGSAATSTAGSSSASGTGPGAPSTGAAARDQKAAVEQAAKDAKAAQEAAEKAAKTAQEQAARDAKTAEESAKKAQEQAARDAKAAQEAAKKEAEAEQKALKSGGPGPGPPPTTA